MADYQELRARTLGSTQEEEAVTVNTRALIDKVLARYSSENTTLRELVQNAADANATSVEIRYETVLPENEFNYYESEGDKLQRLVKSKVRRLLVKNDGQAFREEDWQRLKRIAEGNPDETKIGAFGVGFYSVFADTDEPFISSGNQTMAFYWKKNSLFTRRATMDKVDPSTTFFLEYREPGDLPDLKILSQFLATSLTFVNLESISLYINDIPMLTLGKKVSPPMPLSIPKTIHPRSAEGLMKIIAVETSRVQLDAKYMNITHYKPPKPSAENTVAGFARILFGRSSAPTTGNNITTANLGEYTTATIFLRIATATVATSVSAKFAQELERATKKPPPQRTKISCLTMSKAEKDASEHGEIFENVVPTKSGRVFIGFPTHQTTGINVHIAAHSVIPTVERENIDLNARIIKTWNAEMLRCSGIVARILYYDEMDVLGRRAMGLKPSDLEGLYDEAIHIMQQFTPNDSTPSLAVGDYITEAFWNCTQYTSIELMSTKGVLPSSKIRLANDVTFLEGLPLLPKQLVEGAKRFVDTLKNGGFLTEITISDIQNSLGEKPLNADKAHAFLKWISHQISTGKMDDLQARMVLSGAIAMVSSTDEKGQVVDNALPVCLGAIKYNVNVSRLAPDIPLPADCLPFSLTKKLEVSDLEALGWTELSVTAWVSYIATNSSRLPTEHNINLSSVFASKVLGIVSKNWDRASPNDKAFIVEALKDKTCIPTRQGMKVPREAYFPTVKLFADLPIIHEVRNTKEKFLAALGVRKTVELKLVFERLMGGEKSGTGEKWSHVDLIKYLTTVRDDIPSEDINKLRNMEMCKAEPANSTQIYKVSQLYEPTESLRSLGLPILYWPGEWRDQSLETKFLHKLGLRKFPPEDVVLKLAAGPDKALREKALRYFVDQFHLNEYSAKLVSACNHAFLPLQDDKERLVRPWECYSNSNCSILGYPVIRSDLEIHAIKFGVKPDPDIRDCVARLKKSPPNGPREAREKFGYFADRMKDLGTLLLTDLCSSPIVPVKGPSGVKHITPRVCYIGDPAHKYAAIFDFVDFGTASNAFLSRCGCKPEPTTAEIAYRMAKEPDRLYGIFQSEEKYLSMLRTIAGDWSTLKKDTDLVTAMRSNPCLAAYREISVKGKESADDDDEAIREFRLAKPEDIWIIDDISSYNLFRSDVLAAPEEDGIERFYMALGSAVLSGSIEHRVELGPAVPRTERVDQLHKLVLERSHLFIHSSKNEKIHRDAKWLENNLGINQVQFIRKKMIFRPKSPYPASRTINTTAVVVSHPRRSAQGTGTMLHITSNLIFYDLAQALVKVILDRPKPHSSLLLESLLSTDLEVLKKRGYNVGRILAKKQKEAQLMEMDRLQKVEEQRKALEVQESLFMEQKRQQQQAQQQQQQQQQQQEHQQQREIEEKGKMPGSFGESPEQPPRNQAPVDTGNFLSRGLSKITKLMQEAEKHQSQNTKQLTQGPTPHDNPQTIQEEEHKVGKPTEPHRISSNLHRAVQSARGHGSSNIFSPPATYEVKEEHTFCDSRPSQDITFAAQTPSGMAIYAQRSLPEAERKEFLKTNAAAINTFCLLLNSVAEVFSLPPSALHIYYDPGASTIAFNLAGSIFCNVSFFLQLHAREAAAKKWSAEAFKYWWVTICHELAHNLVSEHGSNHSFYTESFVQEYFGPAMAKVMQLERAAAAPAAGFEEKHILDRR